jgi:hypothetical protein
MTTWPPLEAVYGEQAVGGPVPALVMRRRIQEEKKT